MTRIAGRRHPEPDAQPQPPTAPADYQAEMLRIAGLQLAAQTRMYRRFHFILNVFYTLLTVALVITATTFVIILTRTG